MQSFSSSYAQYCRCVALFLLGVLHVPGPAEALDIVSLITDFGYNGRHAYFFVALDKGYYKAAGLDVKIRPRSRIGRRHPPGRRRQRDFRICRHGLAGARPRQ